MMKRMTKSFSPWFIPPSFPNSFGNGFPGKSCSRAETVRNRVSRIGVPKRSLGTRQNEAESSFAREFLLLFAPTLALLALGCHSLKLVPPIPEKVEKEPVPAAPSKYQLRVSQYLFLADFELNRDLPLFRELADLREQVYKELRSPTANTLIQVHLFDDPQRYESFMHARYPDLPKRRAPSS